MQIYNDHIINEKNEEKGNDNNTAKEGIYIYDVANNNKLLYSFHKISREGFFYELRCRDRSCKGRVKYDIISKDIIITKACSIKEYDDHNYIKETKNRERIKKKQKICQNIYIKNFFEETYIK